MEKLWATQNQLSVHIWPTDRILDIPGLFYFKQILFGKINFFFVDPHFLISHLYSNVCFFPSSVGGKIHTLSLIYSNNLAS